jgi:GNAT superfamily N-acetyltransferase
VTTTLRPTGPEERGADGARARDFHICVNGRPVGTVRLTAKATGGHTAGRIEELSVHAAERRAGRGTVAALAAEEVLRGWGCHRAELGLPPDATAALRLAAALGYTEQSRNMVKTLGDGPGPGEGIPPLPPGTEIRPMTEREYPGWLERERELVITSLTGLGLTREEALAQAENAYRRLLPDGPTTEATALRTLLRDGGPAGWLWMSTAGGLSDDAAGWVYAIEIADRHRGHGLGRALMLEAERICRAVRAPTLGLHVLTGNTPALRLYSSLGYRTSWLNQVKSLR